MDHRLNLKRYAIFIYWGSEGWKIEFESDDLSEVLEQYPDAIDQRGAGYVALYEHKPIYPRVHSNE